MKRIAHKPPAAGAPLDAKCFWMRRRHIVVDPPAPPARTVHISPDLTVRQWLQQEAPSRPEEWNKGSTGEL